MESQKTINLLDSDNSESQKFATKRWYIINDQNSGGNNPYGNGTDNTTIKFETKLIKPNLCDYSDAYILVTGNIKNKVANSTVAFKNCPPFSTCDVVINDEHVEKAEDLDVVMPMYILLEYSDNYQDSTGSLYQFKRDELPDNNANVNANTTSLKYKANLIDNKDNNVKLVVPLIYVSNFFRSLEMPLVNCKIDLELTWDKDCVMSSVDAANANNPVSFLITDAKLYVPIVTLSTKDNTNLTKQLNEGFKRSVYWNLYVSKPFPETPHKKIGISRFSLDAAFQGVNRLFVLAFDDTRVDDPNVDVNNPESRNRAANWVIRTGYRKYFLPRVDITDYNVLIDGRNFYDQPINDPIRKYDEIRKIATGKGDNYTTGCLLDYNYFKKFYQLIAVDLPKQKELDADPRAIQQIEFYGMLETRSNVFTILEKSKETILEFYKGTAKVM